MPSADTLFDVAVVGGGPGGAACATACAGGGLRTVVIERSRFPREKVCGDCLNPVAWPVLRRLGVAHRIPTLPHARLENVDFVSCGGRQAAVPLPFTGDGEIGIRRSVLDAALLSRSREAGVNVREETVLTQLSREGDEWLLQTPVGPIRARYLVAGDGRNSTVCRLFGLAPASKKDRVGLQTHLPLPPELRGRVRMQFVPQGYTGLADVGDGIGNLCLVARPKKIDSLRLWANQRYGLADGQPWRTITPLSRATVHPSQERLLLVGDAARVVEPFTGEGIAYALGTGELAAQALLSGDLPGYAAAHARLYHGRLWVNQLAKQACLWPRLGSAMVTAGRVCPAILGFLTRKVVGASR